MPSTINLQNVQIKNGNTWYTMCPFPIGYIYLSSNSTSPASTYGGTWSALNEDRFLRPSNAWGTGGNAKIATTQLPSHRHQLQPGSLGANAGWDNSQSAGDRLWYGQVAAGRTLWDFYSQNTTFTGGAGLLATLPRLLRLVSHCLIFTCWMEVKNSGNMG